MWAAPFAGGLQQASTRSVGDQSQPQSEGPCRVLARSSAIGLKVGSCGASTSRRTVDGPLDRHSGVEGSRRWPAAPSPSRLRRGPAAQRPTSGQAALRRLQHFFCRGQPQGVRAGCGQAPGTARRPGAGSGAAPDTRQARSRVSGWLSSPLIAANSIRTFSSITTPPTI